MTPNAPPPTARVDIVVVNWNAGAQLRDCLRSVTLHGGGLVARTIVVDNGSVDGSAEAALGEAEATLIAAGVNLGFGKACNLGAARGDAPYILFLNPDAELRPDALARAVAFLDGDRRYGVCGIRLIDDSGRTQRHCARFPDWRAFAGQSMGLGGRLTRLFPPLFMADFDHESSRDVDHVIGAFYLIRRRLFDQLGGFDERFFVYLEDLDLSLRVARSGAKIRYLAEAVAFHRGGGASDQVKARRTFYALRSRLLFAQKHLSAAGALATLGVTLLVEPTGRLARSLVRRSAQEARDGLSGYAMLVKDLPGIWRTARARRDRR